MSKNVAIEILNLTYAIDTASTLLTSKAFIQSASFDGLMKRGAQNAASDLDNLHKILNELIAPNIIL